MMMTKRRSGSGVTRGKEAGETKWVGVPSCITSSLITTLSKQKPHKSINQSNPLHASYWRLGHTPEAETRRRPARGRVRVQITIIIGPDLTICPCGQIRVTGERSVFFLLRCPEMNGVRMSAVGTRRRDAPARVARTSLPRAKINS